MQSSNIYVFTQLPNLYMGPRSCRVPPCEANLNTLCKQTSEIYPQMATFDFHQVISIYKTPWLAGQVNDQIQHERLQRFPRLIVLHLQVMTLKASESGAPTPATAFRSS